MCRYCSCNYSAVRRVLAGLAADPHANERFQLGPGEAAQVDIGAGPMLVDLARGKLERGWCFATTLCFSRHHHVEFAWNQMMALDNRVEEGRKRAVKALEDADRGEWRRPVSAWRSAPQIPLGTPPAGRQS